MSVSRVATIVLNRNLPSICDALVEHIQHYDSLYTDIFVVEAGSDPSNLSKYTTWHAQWDEAVKSGLRYQRGMNYGLSELYKSSLFEQYDYFLLLCNDVVLPPSSVIKTLTSIFKEHPRLGILSPCSPRWGERHLLTPDQPTKYFWFIHNSAYMLRKEMVLDLVHKDSPDYMSFLFDGTNFRGYCAELELIAKAYANDWSAAITSLVLASENEEYLLTKSDLIKTEDYTTNMRLYIEEGIAWMKNKYGFSSKWAMNQYVRSFYEAFFDYHPEYTAYRL